MEYQIERNQKLRSGLMLVKHGVLFLFWSAVAVIAMISLKYII